MPWDALPRPFLNCDGTFAARSVFQPERVSFYPLDVVHELGYSFGRAADGGGKEVEGEDTSSSHNTTISV